MKSDEECMARALRLAALGRHASPNPMVGCVLVSPNGLVVGEGYHLEPGAPHAEANALKTAGGQAAGCTAYVTLEPCSHQGRTPPCADALVAAGVARVVIAMEDPDNRVNGQGVSRLRSAGITVEVGLLEDAAQTLNAAYCKHRITGLPWVLLKSAMSLDGKIATRSGDSRWITSPISRLAVHRQLRDRCDAVVTGIGTVLADDPALTTRLRQREGRNPWRVIVDSRCRISPEALVVKESTADGRTIIATTEGSAESDREFLEGCGCQVIVCESNDTGRVSLEDLLVRLGTRGDVIGVLVEGGAELAAAFLYEGHVDRWLNYIAPIVVGSTAAPGPIGGKGANRMPEALPVRRWNVRRSGRDLAVDSRFG